MDGVHFLETAISQFRDYKSLGEKTFSQLNPDDLFYEPATGCNSIAIIIRHMHGNMKSRWTNFLTEDGEKEWRQRDIEFISPALSQAELERLWQEGWSVLFEALSTLTAADLGQHIYIRTKPLTVMGAVHRQLAHYAYHVGQIVLLGKIIKGNNWQYLSIPPGGSAAYNDQLKK